MPLRRSSGSRMLAGLAVAVLTIGAATVATIGAGTRVAHAGSTWTYDVLTATVPADATPRPLLRLAPRQIRAGDRMYFNASYVARHGKLYFSVRGVPVETHAGCTRLFAIKVLVSVRSGNPVVLEGSTGTQYSNAIAMSY